MATKRIERVEETQFEAAGTEDNWYTTCAKYAPGDDDEEDLDDEGQRQAKDAETRL